MTTLRTTSALALLLAHAGCDHPLPGPTPDASTDAPSTALSAAPSAAVSAAPAAPQKPPKVAIGPGDDRPPERWTTPAESLKAAPPWALEDPRGYNPKAERQNYAPQFPDALFTAAPKAGVVEPDEQVLLACVVSYAGSCDGGFKRFFGADFPELDVEMVIGRAGKLVGHGGEDQRAIEVSIPLVSLAPADRLLFHVFDRDDGGSRDNLGVVTLTPRSLARKQDPAIECRVLGREAVEAKLASEIAEVDKKLDQLADVAPAPYEETLGMEVLQSSLRGPLTRLAGLVGWADPRVARRLTWASRIEARMGEARARFVNEEADRLSRSARFTYFSHATEVEAAGITCGKDAVKPYAKEIAIAQRHRSDRGPLGCILRIRAANVGEEVLTLDRDYPFSWKAFVARSDGQGQKAHVLTIEGPELKRSDDAWDPLILPPGATGTVVLGLSADIQPEGDGAPRPRLIVMNPFHAKGSVLFSLDAPPERPAQITSVP